MNSFIAVPGGWELVLIVLVILLLFGAKKLPELARGSGRALRIFKAETKGLLDDDESKTDAQRQIDAQRTQTIRPEDVHPADVHPADVRPETDADSAYPPRTRPDADR